MAENSHTAAIILKHPVPVRKSKFQTWCRRYLAKPMGFAKLYNVLLFIFFGAALLGFALARASYLGIDGYASSYAQSAAPGEWWRMKDGRYRVGITIHLAAVIPMSILVVWQFLPAIRHKLLIFHRINGYICLILGLIANAGALMIADRSFGGELAARCVIGLLAILTTAGIAMGYYNIKRFQIDQHRAWMLRTFFYYGTIITLHLIHKSSSSIVTRLGGFYQIQSCAEVQSMYEGSLQNTSRLYPICSNGEDHKLVIPALSDEQPEHIAAALAVSFGMAAWLATVLHIIGVEIYLWLTPAETARLRQVSYEKQLEAGMSHPGSAGLTADRWGDAEPFVPADSRPRLNSDGKDSSAGVF